MDVASGRIRRLAVHMPPRHGKSSLASQYFPAWYLGAFPDRRIILASYGEEFASDWGRKVRDLVDEFGPRLFGVSVSKGSSAADRWDIEGHRGGMKTTGIGGSLTGRGADVLLIDDPVKDAMEAQSPTVQRKHWDWYQSTAYNRLEPGGAIILIMTRWNEKDLGGQVRDQAEASGEAWEVINLPALAEDDDPLGRAPGEPLWPARYDKGQLEMIRLTSGSYWWAAQYQQRPAPREGGFFKRAWFSEIVDARPATAKRVRAWDRASTEGGGDYTCGVLMSRTPDGIYTVEDVVRGRWGPGERDKVIRQTAELDGTRIGILGEQEPGSGGKDAARAMVKLLAGYPVHCEPATGPKEVRADGFASQCEVGNVRLARAAWNAAYIDELASFPSGAHDDQVDASSRAFNDLALRPKSSGPALVGGRRPEIVVR